MIQKISFTSTYRIPLSEQGMTPHKKEMLKDFASQFPNHLFRNNRLGHVRISVPEELDEEVETGLKKLFIRVYQKFPEHDIPSKKMNEYIKQELYTGNYRQIGKQKRKVKRHFRKPLVA